MQYNEYLFSPFPNWENFCLEILLEEKGDIIYYLTYYLFTPTPLLDG